MLTSCFLCDRSADVNLWWGEPQTSAEGRRFHLPSPLSCVAPPASVLSGNSRLAGCVLHSEVDGGSVAALCCGDDRQAVNVNVLL